MAIGEIAYLAYDGRKGDAISSDVEPNGQIDRKGEGVTWQSVKGWWSLFCSNQNLGT